MHTPRATWIAAIAVGLLLFSAGCARQQARDTAPRTEATQPDRPAARPSQPPPAAAEPPSSPSTSAPVGGASEGEFTGVQVCDEYLASYKACHATINVVPAEQLDERLAQLRTTLLAKAQNPEERDSMEALCQSLTKTMQEALNGRECEVDESDFVEAED